MSQLGCNWFYSQLICLANQQARKALSVQNWNFPAILIQVFCQQIMDLEVKSSQFEPGQQNLIAIDPLHPTILERS